MSIVSPKGKKQRVTFQTRESERRLDVATNCRHKSYQVICFRVGSGNVSVALNIDRVIIIIHRRILFWIHLSTLLSTVQLSMHACVYYVHKLDTDGSLKRLKPRQTLEKCLANPFSELRALFAYFERKNNRCWVIQSTVNFIQTKIKRRFWRQK